MNSQEFDFEAEYLSDDVHFPWPYTANLIRRNLCLLQTVLMLCKW